MNILLIRYWMGELRRLVYETLSGYDMIKKNDKWNDAKLI